MDRKRFGDACASIGLSLREEQIDAFEAFEEDLYAANEVMNLTRVPRDDCWTRHFLDSLLMHDLVEKSVCDLGTGPGFPAWPLAHAKPNLKVTAADSNSKMCGFLRSHPLPNLEVVQVRAEEWEAWGRFDYVTGRAVAPLSIQLELSARLAKVGGRVILMRTPGDIDEIKRLKNVLEMELERVEQRMLPGTDIERVFPIWKKKRLTPSGYPRKWAEIKKEPL